MLTKAQILNRLKRVRGKAYVLAIKVIKSKDEIERGTAEASELTLTPLYIAEDWQYEYTRRFVKVMIDKDIREYMYGDTSKAEYLAIIGADSEEEANREALRVTNEYARENGFNQFMSETQLLNTCGAAALETAQNGQ